MSKQQWKLLLCAVAAAVMLLVTLFVVPWFRVDLVGNEVEIDLRSASMCAPNGICVSFPLSKFGGFYPTVGSAAFFTGIPVLVLVIVQCASRLVTGAASPRATRFGYLVAAMSIIAGFSAGYLFAPESTGIKEIAMIVVTRTWAPMVFIVGNLVALAAMHMATVESVDDDAGEYKPIKLDKAEKGRLPVTPLSVNRIVTPAQSAGAASPAARERLPDSLPIEGGRPRKHTPSQPTPRIDDPLRAKTPTQPPAVARTSSPSGIRSRSASQQPLGIVEVDARPKSPSQQPLVATTGSPSGVSEPRAKSPSLQALVDPVQRARTSSSGPIDLAARLSAASPQGVLDPLGGAPVGVAIRPPLPQPEPVPPDQIPVDPAAGLTIRKRTPSVANAPVPPSVAAPAQEMVDPRKKTVELPDSAFQPPVAIETPPESGLVIRAKSPTATQRAPTSDGMPGVALEGIPGIDELKDELSKPQAKANASRVATKPLAGPIVEPEAVFPPYIQHKIKYAITTADVSATGITGKREDGTSVDVAWDKIVGVIARRMPPDKPFEGATMVDVVSSAGATLRMVPWTRVRGGLPLPAQAVERARSFVTLVAAQALRAKLDPATKLFADSDGQAAQLPTLATLAAHDERLA